MCNLLSPTFWRAGVKATLAYEGQDMVGFVRLSIFPRAFVRGQALRERGAGPVNQAITRGELAQATRESWGTAADVSR